MNNYQKAVEAIFHAGGHPGRSAENLFGVGLIKNSQVEKVKEYLLSNKFNNASLVACALHSAGFIDFAEDLEPKESEFTKIIMGDHVYYMNKQVFLDSGSVRNETELTWISEVVINIQSNEIVKNRSKLESLFDSYYSI